MKLDTLEFTKDEIDRIVSKVKKYFETELNQELGGFEAEFLVDFFSKEIGSYFYNKGIADAQNLFTNKAEEIGYLIQDLEKVVD
jgi:uncharacterized protein (DUF2164 family)